MVVYLSDGERGGERHFVGKAEAETGEGDAPFPRLGVATVHLAVASHASPAAWQLAAAEEEGWIMTLQTALALAQSLRDERRGDKYLFYLKSATYRVSWEFTCKTTKILLLYIFLAQQKCRRHKIPLPHKAT